MSNRVDLRSLIEQGATPKTFSMSTFDRASAINNSMAEMKGEMNRLRNFEIRESEAKKQREIETLNTQKEILKMQKQQLGSHEKSIELNEMQLQFLKQIDGNTATLLNSMDQLVSSQYTSEVYQAEMLEILKVMNKGETYWGEIKGKFKELSIEKGFEYGFTFFMMAFKFGVAMLTNQ